MQPIIKGTKKKLECSVRGMNYLYLTDDDVDFTVHFYVSGKHSQGCVEVEKKDCHFIYEEGSTDSNILTLSDTDGLEMHRLQPVEWTDEEGNTHPALITRYSRAYMDKHHAWPPALPMTYTGLQFTADYKEMRWLHDTVLKLITKYPV